MTILRRLLLSAWLTVGGMAFGFGGLIALGLAFPRHVAALAMPCFLSGVLAAAGLAARLGHTDGRWRTTAKLFASTAAGMAISLTLTALAVGLGLEMDALSHHVTIYAMVHEAVALTLFYGGMIVSTFAILSGVERMRAVAGRRTRACS